jgi:hypothetical protein
VSLQKAEPTVREKAGGYSHQITEDLGKDLGPRRV